MLGDHRGRVEHERGGEPGIARHGFDDDLTAVRLSHEDRRDDPAHTEPEGERGSELPDTETLLGDRSTAAEAGEVECAHRHVGAEQAHGRLQVVGRHPEAMDEHGVWSSDVAGERAVVHAPAHPYAIHDVPHGVKPAAVRHAQSIRTPWDAAASASPGRRAPMAAAATAPR